MLLVVLILLFVLIVLYTAIQTFYLEGMRLRTRDLPALEFFKEELEDLLGLRSEAGALAFSLWKHACLTAFAVVAMLRALPDKMPTDTGIQAAMIAEALLVSWTGMVLGGYAIPQLLYRRTEGKWLRPLVPFYKVSALASRPLVALLTFGHSLLEMVNPEEGDGEAATAGLASCADPKTFGEPAKFSNVPQSRGPLVPWSFGPLVSWSFGPSAPLSLGPLVSSLWSLVSSLWSAITSPKVRTTYSVSRSTVA